MKVNKMKHRASERTLVTLANAGELVTAITQNIVGNEIADTITGSPITCELIHDLAQTNFQNSLAKYLGA